MDHATERTAVVGVLAVVAAFASSAASGLVQPLVPSSPPRVVVHAGRLLDVKSGRWSLNQNIVIEAGKIARVEAGAAPTGPGATLIDLQNASVLPGLIDAHVHLTLKPSSFGYEILGISEARQTLIGAANAQRTLRAGFTTARNVGAWGFTDVALRDAINEGDVTGPRLLVRGVPLSNTGGHFDSTLLP